MVFTKWNKTSIFHRKKQIFCLFHAFNPFWEKLYQNPVQFFSIIPCGVPLAHSNTLQYYVKREKCKVNDVIFPSGCEALAINLGNKNMKIGIFTGATSVRSNNIFTHISRHSTGKNEIIINSFTSIESVPLTATMTDSESLSTVTMKGISYTYMEKLRVSFLYLP